MTTWTPRKSQHPLHHLSAKRHWINKFRFFQKKVSIICQDSNLSRQQKVPMIIYIYIYIYIYIQVYICVYIYIYVYTCIRTYIYIYICYYIYNYSIIRMCVYIQRERDSITYNYNMTIEILNMIITMIHHRYSRECLGHHRNRNRKCVLCD